MTTCCGQSQPENSGAEVVVEAMPADTPPAAAQNSQALEADLKARTEENAALKQQLANLQADFSGRENELAAFASKDALATAAAPATPEAAVEAFKTPYGEVKIPVDLHEQIQSGGGGQRNSFVGGGGPAVFQHITKGKAGSLNWDNINFSVKIPNGRKEILKNVSGSLRPGSLTCILGPSGSGKTTLLNALSGRTRPGGRFATEMDGKIELNGMPVQPWENQHLFGYVMQEDCLYATESPREILTFAAKLRLNVNHSEMMPLVDDMISSLGLKDCCNTMAGSDIIKGISGGQKKRTSIAAELVTNPAITFLDEPTSGLDTAAAYKVVSVLKELAKAEQSVMATIHQPSSEIFELFDMAIFLAQGQIIYQGPPSGIRAHFSSIGHVCPMDYNPADFVMFTVELASEDVFKGLTTHWAKVGGEQELQRQASPPGGELPLPMPGKGFCAELQLLCARQYRNTIRDKATLGGRFGITIGLNIVFSMIFFQSGDMDASDYTMQSHSGALTMIGINAMFGSVQPAILTFPSERPVFLREYASQMYGVVPYFLSKSIIEFVLLTIQMVLVLLIDYWLIGLHGNIFVHLLAFFLVGASSSSVGLFIGCSIGDIKTAMEITPLAFVPQILFAGFFIKMEQVPIFLRWVQYICGLKWGMNVILINEFGSNGANLPEVQAFLEGNDAKEDLMWIYVLVLVGLIFFFRSVSILKLKKAAASVYS